MANEVVIVKNNLGKCAIALHKAMADHVDEIAATIMDLAEGYAPVKTGFLESSIYIVTYDKSTYGQNVVPPSGDSYMLDEVDQPPNDQTAYVAVAANYGIDIELGTHDMIEQPFLIPAAEAVEAQFASPGNLEDKIANLVGLL